MLGEGEPQRGVVGQEKNNNNKDEKKGNGATETGWAKLTKVFSK